MCLTKNRDYMKTIEVIAGIKLKKASWIYLDKNNKAKQSKTNNIIKRVRKKPPIIGQCLGDYEKGEKATILVQGIMI